MASNDYGVTSTGFVRPSMQEICDEIVAQFPNDLTFASGSVETNLKEAVSKLRSRWLEQAECDFNVQNDYCLARGCQLDNAIEILGYSRLNGESDKDLIARVKSMEQNAGGAFEAQLERKLLELNGVSRVRVYPPSQRLKTGNDACDIETVVQGGNADTIAASIWNCSSGLSNVGTQLLRFEDQEGICREISYTPATVTNYCLRVFVRTFDQSCGCDGQTFESIQNTIFNIVNSTDICSGVGIGGTIRKAMIQIPGVEISRLQFAPLLTDADGNCDCISHDETAWIDGPLVLGCREVANLIDPSCVCVLALPDSV